MVISPFVVFLMCWGYITTGNILGQQKNNMKLYSYQKKYPRERASIKVI